MKLKLLLTTLLTLMSLPAFAGTHYRHPIHHHKHVKHITQFNSIHNLNSRVVLIYDEDKQNLLYDKNSTKVVPIASITKLMTAMVVLDANLPMTEIISIAPDDYPSRIHSRLKVGMRFSRREMLQLALMSSENRAAHSLAVHYPGGIDAFIVAMNKKAKELYMGNSMFYDPTGLDNRNVSTAQDLVKMVVAASGYSAIHDSTTTSSYQVNNLGTRKPLDFHNTNPLVSTSDWDIGLSKTGYIREAGRCLVMQTTINGAPVIIILLDSQGKHSRITDAKNVKTWLIKQNFASIPTAQEKPAFVQEDSQPSLTTWEPPSVKPLSPLLHGVLRSYQCRVEDL